MPNMLEHLVKEDRSESVMTLLKRHQLAAGLDGNDVAKRVGVSPAAYSSWLTGKNVPRPKYFKKLARVLKIDPMTLTRVLVPENSEQVPVENGK